MMRLIFAAGILGLLFLSAPGPIVEAGGKSRIFERKAVFHNRTHQIAHADSAHGDEIDKEIEQYFDRITDTRSVDVDEKRLSRLFPKTKSAAASEGTTSFNNRNSREADRQPEDNSAGIDSHTVTEGDTIYSIAKRYSVSPDSIVKHNPMLLKRPLYIGEEILVNRVKSKRAVSRRVARYRRVRSGDTLSGLARRYGVSVATLRKWNRLRSTSIRVGQRLKVGYRSRTRIPRGYAVRPMFRLPVDGGRITSRFGRRRNPFFNRYRSFHKGIDIGAGLGTPFLAARGGVVIRAQRMGGYGNCIFIRHSDGYVSVYAHSKKMNVQRGDVVKRGQVIGYVGRTGNATGPHLHFEVRRRKKAINPLAAIRMRELVPGKEIRNAAMR